MKLFPIVYSPVSTLSRRYVKITIYTLYHRYVDIMIYAVLCHNSFYIKFWVRQRRREWCCAPCCNAYNVTRLGILQRVRRNNALFNHYQLCSLIFLKIKLSVMKQSPAKKHEKPDNISILLGVVKCVPINKLTWACENNDPRPRFGDLALG